MNRPLQARCRLAAVFVAAQLAVFSVAAQTTMNFPAVEKNSSVLTNIMPPMPQAHSPVDFFRKLLAMSPRDRNNFLTNKPPEVRALILGKIKEYLALGPDERELRLRATELRWYLMPLLHESPTNRDALLAQIPDGLRGLAKSRLTEWDILPPPVQQEFLANERALRYFAHIDPTNNPPPQADQTRWNALSEDERQQVADRFNHFFELTPKEKQKTLNQLSDAERGQMEKTLQSFDNLPAPQRVECIRAFTKFADMSAADRAEFLKNAGRWSQMSPAERQSWRDLVKNVPQWPPLPTGANMPPTPENFQSAVATNHS